MSEPVRNRSSSDSPSSAAVSEPAGPRTSRCRVCVRPGRRGRPEAGRAGPPLPGARGPRGGRVHDGRAALDEARRRPPDLLVLDVMMPGVDGLDVCRILRAESDVPVLMLTARATEDDLLLGLDLGADDYMTKPYSPRELMARVRTLLRRAPTRPPPARPGAAGRRAHGRPGRGTRSPSTARPVECTPGRVPAPRRRWPPSPAGCSPGEQLLEPLPASTGTSPTGPSTCT